MNEIDPWRLLVAAHELGHGLAWASRGWNVKIKVTGRGSRVGGYAVKYGNNKCKSVEDVRIWIAGLIAGGIAGDMWSEIYGIHYSPPIKQTRGHCAIDEYEFRKTYKDALKKELLPTGFLNSVSEADLKNDAKILVRKNWDRIERLSPKLATTGFIRV